MELRLALAMRGGVSLAAWIGGAVAELDLVRRAMLQPAQFTAADDDTARARAEALAALLRELGYSRLTIDVLAGTSAGGLNAVIYGWAQAVGTHVEWVRGVWETQGDLLRLFHPQWSRGEPYRTEGVLAGDAFFYNTVLRQLEDLSDKPVLDALRTDYLTIDLAATLQGGPPLRSRRGVEDLRPRTAHFRFRKTSAPVGLFNDLPGPPPEDPAPVEAAAAASASREALKALAYAARATSSFPGAFEPAEVFSRPSGAGGLRSRAPEDIRPENMAEVFSEITAETNVAFDVIDGGVFDNIPISRAVAAISDVPAGGRTKRILVYLDPDPPQPAAIPVTHESVRQGVRLSRARFLRSILIAIRYKQAVESSDDDLREISRLQAAATDTRQRRTAFRVGLPASLPTDDAGWGRLEQAYRAHRDSSDADRVVALMMAPGVGFLRALVRNPSVATALSTDYANQLRPRLTERLKELKDRPPPQVDGVALVAVTNLLISWVRVLLDSATGPEPVVLTEGKSRLYLARTAGLYVQQRHDKEAVLKVLGDAGAPPAPDTLIDPKEIAEALRPAPVGDSPPAHPLVDDAEVWTLLDRAESSHHASLGFVVDRGWATVCSVVNSLSATPQTNPILTRLSAEVVKPPLTPELAQRLAMAATVAIGSLNNTAVPEFFSFSGDEQPFAMASLPFVQEEERAIALDEAFAVRPGVKHIMRDRPVSAASKLAGNQLANFAGFLDAEWRLHDWQWGRADAGAGLIRALARLHPGRVQTTRSDAETAVTTLYDAHPGVAALDRHKYRLGDLAPDRRFAIGSRLLLAVQRALWPLTEPSRSVSGLPGPAAYVGALALIALRPLLVVLPLLLRPMSLVGVILVTTAEDHLSRERTLPPALLAWLAAMLAALMVVRLVQHLHDRARWKRLEQDGYREIVVRVRKAALRAGIRGAAVLVATLAVGVIAIVDLPGTAWVREMALSASAFDVFVVVAVCLWLGFGSRVTAVRAIRARKNPLTADRGGAAGAAVMCIAAAAVVVVRSLYAGELRAESGAIAVAAVVWGVHYGLTSRLWCWLLPLVSGLMTYGLLAWGEMDGAGAPRPRWQLDTEGLQPLVDIGAFLVVALLVFMLALLARALGSWGGILGLCLLLAGALAGAWLVLLQWDWLAALPRGLVLGAAAAAATTLVVPFSDETEREAQA